MTTSQPRLAFFATETNKMNVKCKSHVCISLPGTQNDLCFKWKRPFFFGGGGGFSKIEVICLLYIHRKTNICFKELTYPTYIEKGNLSSREGIYFLLERVLKFQKQV